MFTLCCKQGSSEHSLLGQPSKGTARVNFSVLKSKYSGLTLAHWRQTLDDLEWGKLQKFRVWDLREFFCWLQWILEHVLNAIQKLLGVRTATVLLQKRKS